MACCDEPGCTRSTPILLRQSGLTGRVYVITRHHHADGRIVADVKHDVTEEADLLFNFFRKETTKP